MFGIARKLPTASAAIERIHANRLRAETLLNECRQRILAMDCQAWVDGEQLRANIASRRSVVGRSSFPAALTGVAIGVKDIIDVAGWPTRGGSTVTPEDPAERDAPVVSPLREAGATILGKTVTCQFACFDPAETKNPWDPTRTPGGSSAGSAAAVALGQCLIALGTQTGGSILRPASYCGVCGFKPAHDPRWLEGVLPVSAKLDHVGPLARSVADLELAWRIITGYRPERHQARTPRFGVLRDYFWPEATADVRALTDAAIGKLQDAGADVLDVPLPRGFEHVHLAHRHIMMFDVARQHIAQFKLAPHAYKRKLALMISEGLRISPSSYAQAVDFQRQFREQLLVSYLDFDALLMPATTSTAPTTETTGDAAFNVPWSFAGVAAVCLPIGLASDGLPCGLQLVKPHGLEREHEFDALALARWCEAVLGVDLWPELNKRLEQQFPHAVWVDEV